MVRIKHRYLLLNVLYPEDESIKQGIKSKVRAEVPWSVQFRQPSSDSLDARLLLRVIRDGIAELFGDYGSGMVSASLQIKYLSSATSTAILRVSRAHFRLVWAALSFVTHIPKPVDRACAIQVVRVSGTIRKSEEEAIRRARLAILQANNVETSQIRPADNARFRSVEIESNNTGDPVSSGDEYDEDDI